jgi:TolB-like protein/Flp pilus assembly protein TadD
LPAVPELPSDPAGDAFRDQLQSSLGTGYTLERELGGGGMSRVFVVDEIRLRRKLVVKVLSAELAAGVSAERFQREIELAASLQQANIVPLLAVGEADGLPYYTMPFVDGLSLRARLEQNGALPFGEAISVLRDVARALAYAHDHGVVHRDIKPDNILLSGAAAVVADFGIAKALAASKRAMKGGTLTQVGTSIGTPAYMAPEQSAGDPDTDHRADLYALGCVGYEMLTGAAPFAGRATHQLLAAHMTERPASIEAARPGVPHTLAALVMRCLEKDPVARPQSAGAVLEALDEIGPISTTGDRASRAVGGRRRSLILMAGLMAIGVAAAFGAWQNHPSNASAGPTTIAVLPFENQGEAADGYFSDGITDAVRGKLTSLSGSGLAVIARSSSVSYRGTTKAPAAIASELGVRYLLTGTVRFAGSGDARRVQVNPELVEMVSGHAPESRWTQPFNAPVKDVFAVQADIASRVATAMQIALGSSAKAQLAHAPTHDPAAYDAFLRADAMRNAGGAVDPRAIRRTLAAYDEAIEHDSAMALAWARRSGVLSNLYFTSTPSPELGRAALEAAERAITLDSGGIEGYLALASYHRNVDNDLAQALVALARARAVAPEDPAVRFAASLIEANLGHLETAQHDLAEVLKVDPRNASIWTVRTYQLLRLGRVAEARMAADRGLALAPTSASATHRRVLVEAAAGDVAAARQVLSRSTHDVPRETMVPLIASTSDLGWLLDADDARLLLTLGADAFDGDRAVLAVVRAQQYGWRGDAALARTWGDSAARAFAVQLRAVPTDPKLHVLRGLALAYAGHRPEALLEAESSLTLLTPTPSGRESLNYGYVSYVAARTALLVGDRERALSWLAESRGAHYFVTPAWLRVDPTWAPLRQDPRFSAFTSEPHVGR